MENSSDNSVPKIAERSDLSRIDLPSIEREALAEFLESRKDKIRGVARSKLAQVARSLFDSEDVFASVSRAMDELAAAGKLRPHNEHELWALTATMARNNAISKVRLASRAKALVAEDGVYARTLLARAEECRCDGDAAVLCLRLMVSLESPDDRRLFALRLRGASHRVAAGVLGINEESCRQRWQGIRERLADAFRESADE